MVYVRVNQEAFLYYLQFAFCSCGHEKGIQSRNG
jgi:hypothetical protein